jgi:hypothetical protein
VPPRLRRRPGPRRIRSQTRVLRLPPRLPRPPLRLVSGCSEFRSECLEQKGGAGGRRRVSGSVCTMYEGVVSQRVRRCCISMWNVSGSVQRVSGFSMSSIEVNIQAGLYSE